MTRTMWPIFRKDARHLWPQIASFLVLLAGAAIFDPAYAARSQAAAGSWLGFLAMLACWILVIAVIHEDKLTSEQADWLIRPYHRGGLLAAKILFATVFINLPVLLTQVVVMACLGIPPLGQLPALLWRQVFLTAILILPAAALAAITSSLREAFLTVVLTVAPIYLAVLVLTLGRVRIFFMGPGSQSYWLKDAFQAAVALVFGAAILLLQYRRRATTLSRVTLGLGVALALFFADRIVPQNREFSIQAALSPRWPQSGAIGIELDPSPGILHDPGYSRERSQPGMVHVEVPIRVAGAPGGAGLLLGTRAETTLKTEPPLPVYSEIRDLPGVGKWLSFDISRVTFFSLRRSPVRISGQVPLTLFARAATVPAPAGNRVAVPGFGACANYRDADGKFAVRCFTPFASVPVALEYPNGGRQWIVSRAAADVPFPTAFDFGFVEARLSQLPFASADEIGALRLVTERAMAHLEPSFDFAIHLDDYAHGVGMLTRE